jgi:hypothetical protein
MVRKKEEERKHSGARAVAREKDRILIKIIVFDLACSSQPPHLSLIYRNRLKLIVPLQC